MIEPVVLDELSRLSHDDDDLDHYFCCDVGLALCGKDISGEPVMGYAEPDENSCVVCVDLLYAICPRCGE